MPESPFHQPSSGAREVLGREKEKEIRKERKKGKLVASLRDWKRIGDNIVNEVSDLDVPAQAWIFCLEEDLEVSGFIHQLAIFLLFCSNYIITITLVFPSNDCKHCPYMSKQMFIYAEKNMKKIPISQMGKWEKLKYFLGFSMKFVAELQGNLIFPVFSLAQYFLAKLLAHWVRNIVIIQMDGNFQGTSCFCHYYIGVNNYTKYTASTQL